GSYGLATSHEQGATTNAQAQADNVPIEIDGVCCYNFKASNGWDPARAGADRARRSKGLAPVGDRIALPGDWQMASVRVCCCWSETNAHGPGSQLPGRPRPRPPIRFSERVPGRPGSSTRARVPHPSDGRGTPPPRRRAAGPGGRVERKPDTSQARREGSGGQHVLSAGGGGGRSGADGAGIVRVDARAGEGSVGRGDQVGGLHAAARWRRQRGDPDLRQSRTGRDLTTG